MPFPAACTIRISLPCHNHSPPPLLPFPFPLPLPIPPTIPLPPPAFLPPKPTNHKPLSSLTISSNASLISALTSSSQFSFILSAQLVCCTNRCSNPHFMLDICGREELMWSVMRCEPREREGRRRGCWVYVVDILRRVVGRKGGAWVGEVWLGMAQWVDFEVLMTFWRSTTVD